MTKKKEREKREDSPETKHQRRLKYYEKKGIEPRSSSEAHWAGIETRGSEWAYKSVRKAGASKKVAAMISSKHKDPAEAVARFKNKTAAGKTRKTKPKKSKK